MQRRPNGLREFAARARAFPPKVNRAATNGEAVILLHGLGRSRLSLFLMERALRRAGYLTCNLSYPSTKAPLEDLADEAINGAIAQVERHRRNRDAPIHFVTHSMGGILLRAWFAGRSREGFGRAVLLAPPNRGSELVDTLVELGLAETALGPAGAALGSGPDDAPNRLPDLPLHYGVIAGVRSLNPISSAFVTGRDDGKVSVASTMLPGAADHIELPVSHTLMMNEPMTIWQTAHFLRHGAFLPEARLSRLKRDTILS